MTPSSLHGSLGFSFRYKKRKRNCLCALALSLGLDADASLRTSQGAALGAAGGAGWSVLGGSGRAGGRGSGTSFGFHTTPAVNPNWLHQSQERHWGTKEDRKQSEVPVLQACCHRRLLRNPMCQRGTRASAHGKVSAHKTGN